MKNLYKLSSVFTNHMYDGANTGAFLNLEVHFLLLPWAIPAASCEGISPNLLVCNNQLRG